MTESELIEAGTSFHGLMYNWVTLYFSVFAAYVATAYFVGAKLTTRQSFFLSAVFCVFSMQAIFSAYEAGAKVVAFEQAVNLLNASLDLLASPSLLISSIIVLTVSAIGALKFMWDVRHPQN